MVTKTKNFMDNFEMYDFLCDLKNVDFVSGEVTYKKRQQECNNCGQCNEQYEESGFQQACVVCQEPVCPRCGQEHPRRNGDSMFVHTGRNNEKKCLSTFRRITGITYGSNGKTWRHI